MGARLRAEDRSSARSSSLATVREDQAIDFSVLADRFTSVSTPTPIRKTIHFPSSESMVANPSITLLRALFVSVLHIYAC